MAQYSIISENDESTVLSELPIVEEGGVTYQTEAALESAFIKQLQSQGYEYLPINSEQDLIDNLRKQLSLVNDYKFTDSEWERFFKSEVANKNDGIVEKTQAIQEAPTKLLEMDNGQKKNIRLIDKTHIHNNRLQVINQYVPTGGNHATRYDVTILVNGLPLVHVELKRRGISIKEAFNQINRYQRDSFWADSGLYEYVQIFVISNGTETKYYSNTTRWSHIKEVEKAGSGQQTSNSFEFTSHWATTDNKPILDLRDFTATFFVRHCLLNVLTKYCVFTAEHLLLVMRPYQIAATEAIINQIYIAYNSHKYGSRDAGGYIWHTTGSGKTLTSFKAARVASTLPFIDKVLFVVDRKDLDYQTMKEYDRFERGAANSNTSTAVLKRQLEDPKARIIITTIQKLSIFIEKNPKHDIYGKQVVMIFDECHRSQFGDMHADIVKKFKAYYLFGFTGTPIFPQNAGASSGHFDLATTAQAFGRQLHVYTIIDAIRDGNVLPFKVDYISTMREQEDIQDEQVSNIDRERALSSPKRISRIVEYVLAHFDQKTKRNSYYKLKDRRVKGFNSIFACASIPVAKLYYTEFQQQMQALTPDKRLKVAIIYSYGVNEDAPDLNGIIDDENPENTDKLDKSSRDFLDAAIQDYNAMFRTNFDTSSDGFQGYYKDVSMRMKNRDLDLLIVVNMFLTGFDATTLNTLWVDKNLRLHGLLQAYSRTNRILNSVKTFGNIVCFRNLEKATNDSISLFGDKDAGGIVILRSFEDYYRGYQDSDGKRHIGYVDLVKELQEKYPVGELIVGEDKEKAFIRLYGAILKMLNVLTAFDQFDEEKQILSPRDVQDYHSMYISLYDKYRHLHNGESADITKDIEFEIELIKQVEINIDYILELVKKMHGDHTKDKEIRVNISKAIMASPDLRSKKELIEQFIDQLTPDADVDDSWQKYVKRERKQQLDEIIVSEKLKPEETYAFIKQAFAEGKIEEEGTSIVKILPPMPVFGGQRKKKKETVLDKLKVFFEKFFDISNDTD